MHGLDNVTAEGTEAFDKISAIVESLEEYGLSTASTQKLLKDGKRYLKTDYKTHVGKEERCTDHCTVYALNDKAISEFSAECDHEHQYQCERCEAIEQVKDRHHNNPESFITLIQLDRISNYLNISIKR